MKARPEIPDYVLSPGKVLKDPEGMVFRSEEARKAFYRTYGPGLVEKGVITAAELRDVLDNH